MHQNLASDKYVTQQKWKNKIDRLSFSSWSWILSEKKTWDWWRNDDNFFIEDPYQEMGETESYVQLYNNTNFGKYKENQLFVTNKIP